MSRRHLTFACAGETLFATLDEAPGTVGLLIVTGGNEVRSGAFGGQAQLAARFAAAGFPVFRFDRRGVGDSTGTNRGFRDETLDILASIATFRQQCPNMNRMVAFGNCDAASALMLMRGDMCDGLVLSNPWTFDDSTSGDALPPPEAIRARYASKLRNPAEIGRLLRGQISFSRLFKGLISSLRKVPQLSSLAQEMATGLDAATKPYVILLAGNDRTAQAFAAGWDGANGEVRHCAGASHAFAEPHASKWLDDQILAMLNG